MKIVTHTIVSFKVKGGALYIAILVSILIGITLSLFILLANYNQRNVTIFSQDSQLYFNLKSAFQLAQSKYFSPTQNNVWIKNQINDDSIKVKKLNWGAYLVISAETKNRHHSLNQSELFGTYMSADTGLIISDNSRPVGVSGAIHFKSNCYLPKAGIKPAYIEGQSYVSSSSNNSFIRQSPQQIPMINSYQLKGLKEEMKSYTIYLDSAVSRLPEYFDQSFRNKTLVWENSASRLSNVVLRNNIKLVCESITIDSTAHLENILVVCKNIRFKTGFHGKIHVIASDSIGMEEGCTFEYPSSFVLMPDGNSFNTFNYIQFNKNCKFYGAVLALNEHSNSTNSQKVFIKLNADCEINGLIYSSDYIHLQGTLNATVIAGKLLLKTASAVYENHMLGCEINPKKHKNNMAVPLVFDQRAKLLSCEKLN